MYFDIMNQSAEALGLPFDRSMYDQFMKYKDLLKE